MNLTKHKKVKHFYPGIFSTRQTQISNCNMYCLTYTDVYNNIQYAPREIPLKSFRKATVINKMYNCLEKSSNRYDMLNPEMDMEIRDTIYCLL